MSRFIKFFFIVWLIGGAYYFIAYIVGRIQIYGYLDNKKINKSNTPYFKDVPCNDVFYAAGLIGINTCSYEKMNIIGAVLLYWIKNNKIKVIKNNGEIFLQFVAPLPFEGRQFESELYEMFISMSQDGILRGYEYKKWVRGVSYKRYEQFENEARYVGKKELFDKNLIWKKDKENCKKYYVMADVLYEDYRKIYGLNLFLQNKENYNLNMMNPDL